MSAEPNPHLDEVFEIIGRVERQDPSINTLLAAQQIADLGFYLIGTAISQEIHAPTIQTYYEMDFMQDFSFNDDPNKPLVQATWAGSLAIEAAIFGDWNIKDQRRLLGDPLTEQRYSYGWKTKKVSIVEPDDEGMYSLGEEADLFLHAERPLLQAVKQRGSRLTGSIDIVDGANDFRTPTTAYEDEEDIFYTIDRPGIIICYSPVPTVATLPVTGPDLWLTNISSEEYDKKQ